MAESIVTNSKHFCASWILNERPWWCGQHAWEKRDDDWIRGWQHSDFMGYILNKKAKKIRANTQFNDSGSEQNILPDWAEHLSVPMVMSLVETVSGYEAPPRQLLIGVTLKLFNGKVKGLILYAHGKAKLQRLHSAHYYQLPYPRLSDIQLMSYLLLGSVTHSWMYSFLFLRATVVKKWLHTSSLFSWKSDQTFIFKN